MDAFEMQAYDVPVVVNLDDYDDFQAVEMDVRALAAHGIMQNDDRLEDKNREYLEERVEADFDGLRAYFADDETNRIEIETRTTLGVIND